MHLRRRLVSQNTLEPPRLKKSLTKRPKLTETLQNGTSSYLRVILVWIIVIALDLALDFRLEFLWPCWMFLKRIFESFKYKSCMSAFVLMGATFCSDYFVYAFIPSSWIFFVASTYVWTQQLISPERGIGLPMLALWMVFVYVESCIRVHYPGDHWGRVLGSNCIGYPVVMLGFGFKSCMKLHWADKCRQLISCKNDFFYRLTSTHAESTSLYHAPARAFKRTNLLKLRYKMRYSGSDFVSVEDVPFSDESVQSARVNGLLQDMNSNKNTNKYTQVIPGSSIDEVSPLTGRSWNFNSISRTFLGHTVDPNEDFWNNVTEEESEPPTPPPEPVADMGTRRNNNILAKMFDFREKPSAKVSPVMDNIPEPVKEARVSPIKKEKVIVEEPQIPIKSYKAEKKSKKQSKIKQEYTGYTERDDHTAMKIHLDRLKDIDDDLYFQLQDHLDCSLNNLKEEKAARLQAELICDTLEDQLRKTRSDLTNSKTSELTTGEKLDNVLSQNKSLQNSIDKQRSEHNRKLQEMNVPTKDKQIGCDLTPPPPKEDHTKCQNIAKSHEDTIDRLKKEIDGQMKKNDQDLFNNLQKLENENIQSSRQIDDLTKQNSVMKSNHESIIRSLRAETKVKIDLFSALSVARRETDELKLTMETCKRENDMLKKRIAEAMAVSSFPTASFTTTQSSDTFYSANGF